MTSMRRQWAWVLIAAVTVSGILFSSWIAGRSDTQLRQDLLLRARIIADSVNLDDVKALSFTLEDRSDPGFVKLGAWMKKLAGDMGCRSLYTMALRGDTLVFGPESLAPGDPDASPPGTVYRSPPESLRQVFRNLEAVTAGPYRDEYGTFVSAYSPVIDPVTKRVIMVIGMDVEAADWKWSVISDAALPVSLTFLLVFLLLFHVSLQKAHTALHARETSLDESEKKYRHLFESMTQGVVYQDSEGRILDANPAAQRILGLDLDQLRGRTSLDPGWEAVHEDGSPYPGDTHPAMLAMKSGSPVFHSVMGVRHQQGGGYRWIDVDAIPMFNPGEDRPGQVYTTFEDITERRRVEKAVRDRQARLDSIIRVAPTGIGVVSNRILVEVNDRICEMTGYGREELVGQSARVLYPTREEYDYVGSEKYRQIAEKGTGTVETRWLRRDGSLIDIILSSTPIDPLDLSAGVTFTALDITKRKQAERDLQETNQMLQAIIDASPLAIFTLDHDLRVTSWSPAAERIFGWTRDEAVGRRNPIVPEEKWEEFEGLVSRVLSGTGYSHSEVWRRTRDGRPVCVNVSTEPLRDAGGRVVGALGVIQDMTERKRIEDEKKLLEAQLAQAQKMESIGTLAGGIAHDFNNILSAIIGYSELALDDARDQEKAKAEIREAIKAADRAKELVKQILTFSRKTEVSYSPLALRSVVNESIKMLRPVIPSNIEILEDLHDTGLVMSDPAQINQIVMNLFTNAVHAMDRTGGVIEVGLRDAFVEDRDRPALGLDPGGYLKLTVRDTGHGMPPEVVDRIFDPYFTTKEVGKGTGLGLSVVLGIVKSHRGSITCASAPGKGTTFEIYLPALHGMTETEKLQEDLQSPGGNERILFVDDEPAIVTLAQLKLKKFGYDIVTNTSSTEALKLFEQDPQGFDLVVTDMTMPGITGDSLAQRMMAIRPDIPVILCTGYSEHISAERAKTIGIREYCPKPLRMKSLATAIRRVLDQCRRAGQ